MQALAIFDNFFSCYLSTVCPLEGVSGVDTETVSNENIHKLTLVAFGAKKSIMTYVLCRFALFCRIISQAELLLYLFSWSAVTN